MNGNRSANPLTIGLREIKIDRGEKEVTCETRAQCKHLTCQHALLSRFCERKKSSKIVINKAVERKLVVRFKKRDGERETYSLGLFGRIHTITVALVVIPGGFAVTI